MSDLPVTKIISTLKQISFSDSPEFLQGLFAALFPRFYDQSEWSWDEHPEAKKSLESIPKVVLGQPRTPRRFGGYFLPRRRYYAVSSDSEGNDQGTLVNELRAYRDPVRTGMVEIMDFGMGKVVLALDPRGDRTVAFERVPQLGVIIHRPEPFEELLTHIPHDRPESKDSKRVALVKFPYRVDQVELSRTIDLREPETRAWFGAQFSKPNDDWVWPEWVLKQPGTSELPEKPQTIVSMYERSDGQAPAPHTFVEMLPTLLNPVRGGGDLQWGGLTLMAIGEWLRNRDVDALIYPSSRSDAFVSYENGKLCDFGGWCLVDYRRDESDTAAHYVVVDMNPWSWVALPSGVTVAVGKDGSPNAGSFMITGVVEQARTEYLHQIESLRVAEETLGPTPSAITPHEAFAWGVFMFRWLHLAFASGDQEDITAAYRIASGVTLRNDREYFAGKIRWIFNRLAEDGEGKQALNDLLETASEIENSLPEGSSERSIYSAAIDLELVLLILARAAIAGQTTIKPPLSAPGVRALDLPPELKTEADAFLRAIEIPESTIAACSQAGVDLARGLSEYYAQQSSV